METSQLIGNDDECSVYFLCIIKFITQLVSLLVLLLFLSSLSFAQFHSTLNTFLFTRSHPPQPTCCTLSTEFSGSCHGYRKTAKYNGRFVRDRKKNSCKIKQSLRSASDHKKCLIDDAHSMLRSCLNQMSANGQFKTRVYQCLKSFKSFYAVVAHVQLLKLNKTVKIFYLHQSIGLYIETEKHG
jgi:hypothetical protein